jgi:hypothetical protein
MQCTVDARGRSNSAHTTPRSRMHPIPCVAPHPPQAAHATARMHFTLARRSCRRKHSDSIRDRRTDACTRTDRLPSSQKRCFTFPLFDGHMRASACLSAHVLSPLRLPCMCVLLSHVLAACRDCSAPSCPPQTNMHQLDAANHAASEAILARLIHLRRARNP